MLQSLSSWCIRTILVLSQPSHIAPRGILLRLLMTTLEEHEFVFLYEKYEALIKVFKKFKVLVEKKTGMHAYQGIAFG